MTTDQSPLASMRDWLRALPAGGSPSDVPAFDPEQAPPDPLPLFRDWITAAAGVIPLPHAAVLATAGADGQVGARTLILKDLDERGWYFATQTTSPKARALAANPHAALTFLWTAMRRQVRVQGTVRALGAEQSAADFLARPEPSRASCLTGTQSEPLTDLDTYQGAYARALQRVQDDPDLVAENWGAYRLEPRWVEFWQSAPGQGQVRLRYERLEHGWRAGLRWP